MLLREFGKCGALGEFIVHRLEEFLGRCLHFGFLFVGGTVGEFFQDVPCSHCFHRREFSRIFVVVGLDIRFGDVIRRGDFDKLDVHLFFFLIDVAIRFKVCFRFSVVHLNARGVIGVSEFDELQFCLVRLNPKILFDFGIRYQFEVLDGIAQCCCAEL